jgi:transposase InsO family protein
VSGSRLKWLSAVDEYTRECLALKVDRGITSENVSDTLSELFAMRGVPRHIRGDNGPELIAQTLRRWLKKAGVGSLYGRRETRPAARGASGGPFGSQQRRSHPRGV